MFATDRDLLVIEPALFRDVGFAALVRGRATGSIASGVLTVSGINLAALGVDAGSVVLVNDVALEVIERLSAATASVSLLRASAAAPAVAPANLASASVVVPTFAPQIQAAHARILRAAGLDPQAPEIGASGTTPGEAMILNTEALRAVECLGALEAIYRAASALGGPDSPEAKRADQYAQRYERELRRTGVVLDLDADGAPDARRAAGLTRVRRV